MCFYTSEHERFRRTIVEQQTKALFKLCLDLEHNQIRGHRKCQVLPRKDDQGTASGHVLYGLHQ